MRNLDDIRLKINKIDEEMAKLFESRMNLAKEVAEYKIAHAIPIENKGREQDVIDLNSQYIQNDEIKEYYVNFIKNNMDLSKKYQSRIINNMKIAYCGVEGAFAHIATMKLFPNAKYVSYPSFKDAYEATVIGECDSCVLPLENSFAGDVGHVLDLLFSGNLYVNQVIDLEVVQNLLVVPGTKLENIKTVISHPQALSQCSDFINSNNFQTKEMTNTAVSAKIVSESNDNSIAAIASEYTATLYNLEILKSNINSSNLNTTRFGAFSRILHSENKNQKSGNNFILVFTVKNEAGSLAKALNIIGSYNFNMRSLRSRPNKELMWNYYFYVELEGNVSSEDGKEMLKALKIFCDKLKIVGVYNLE